jgi:hypothetical protein
MRPFFAVLCAFRLLKEKARLRSAAARTRDALWDTTGQLLDTFGPAQGQNYLENSGYALD